jgi:hypothetical protein
MKLLLRDKATKQYLQHDSSWGGANSAWDFDDLSDLMHFIHETGYENTELVLSILNEPSDHDITIDFPNLQQHCRKNTAD